MMNGDKLNLIDMKRKTMNNVFIAILFAIIFSVMAKVLLVVWGFLEVGVDSLAWRLFVTDLIAVFIIVLVWIGIDVIKHT